MTELQKKVKVLQQRHRRHLEKLVGLENTVSQLRQSNLLNEERLQLLERVFTWIYVIYLKSESLNFCCQIFLFGCKYFPLLNILLIVPFKLL